MFDYRKAKYGGTEKEILAYEAKQMKKAHVAKKMSTKTTMDHLGDLVKEGKIK